MSTLTRSVTYFVLIFFIISCVDNLDVVYQLKSKVLTIEGVVSDEIGGTYARIQYSQSDDKNLQIIPVTKCQVEILIDNTTRIQLKEAYEGTYIPTADFKGQKGKSYQLILKTPEGKTYQSTIEALTPVPPIKKIYQRFNKTGNLNATGDKLISSTSDIFVDFDDPAETNNYYLWTWKQYEKHNVCATCPQGYLNSKTLECVVVKQQYGTFPSYDYRCAGDCWDIAYNDQINILSDVFVKGRGVIGRPIAKIPFYSEANTLIQVNQYSISKGAFDYYNLLQGISEKTGTLTDTPPAPIIGNIANVNSASEVVVGYFMATGSSSANYSIERTPNINEATFTSRLDHPLFYEPDLGAGSPPLFEVRAPKQICKEGKNRTPKTPAGWK